MYSQVELNSGLTKSSSSKAVSRLHAARHDSSSCCSLLLGTGVHDCQQPTPTRTATPAAPTGNHNCLTAVLLCCCSAAAAHLPTLTINPLTCHLMLLLLLLHHLPSPHCPQALTCQRMYL
jgi:hypothetical protein